MMERGRKVEMELLIARDRIRELERAGKAEA